MGWFCALVGLLGFWVMVLRRQVDRLNEAVRQQLDQQVALDERYADLTAGVIDAVFALDLEGRFTAVNAASQAIVGLSHAEILRGTVFDLIAPDSREETRQCLARAVANHGRGDRRFETAVVAHDGRSIKLSGQFRLLTVRGVAVGFEGVAHTKSDATRPRRDSAAPRPVDPAHRLLA